jgi:hypothetical protein
MVAKAQKDKNHIFPHMWELDLKDKYIFKYIYDLIYIYREKE